MLDTEEINVVGEDIEIVGEITAGWIQFNN